MNLFKMKKNIVLMGLALAFGAQAFAGVGIEVDHENDRGDVKDHVDTRKNDVDGKVLEARKTGVESSIKTKSTITVDFSKMTNKMDDSQRAAAVMKAEKQWGQSEVTPHLDAAIRAADVNDVKKALTHIENYFGKDVREQLETLPSDKKIDGMVLLNGLADAAKNHEALNDGLTRSDFMRLVRNVVAFQKNTGNWPINSQMVVAECTGKLDAAATRVFMQVFDGAKDARDLIKNSRTVKSDNFGELGSGDLAAYRWNLELEGDLTDAQGKKTGEHTACAMESEQAMSGFQL